MVQMYCVTMCWQLQQRKNSTRMLTGTKAALQDSYMCEAKELSCDNGNILGLGQSEELDCTGHSGHDLTRQKQAGLINGRACISRNLASSQSVVHMCVASTMRASISGHI